MNKITFEIQDKQGQSYKKDYSTSNSHVFISDTFILGLFHSYKIKEIKSLDIILGVDRMALTIKNYTLTPLVCIDGFYNIKSNISIMQVSGVNIHVVNQNIEHLQADCESILLASCFVEKFDLGLSEHVKNLRNGDTSSIFNVKKLDLRNNTIGNLDIYAECDTINIQDSKISNLNNIGNLFKECKSTVQNIYLWQNTMINRFSCSNKVENLKFEDTIIERFIALHNFEVINVKTENTIIENCYGFNSNSFKNPTCDSWRWVGKSAQIEKNLDKRADAYYQVVKASHKSESFINNILYWIFDFSAGFGYKPLRVIRTSGIMVLLNTVLFSLINFMTILTNHSITIDGEFIGKCVVHCWNNFLIAASAFVGQSGLCIADGIIFWLGLLEYLIGVILFAMFVNALYLRYGE